MRLLPLAPLLIIALAATTSADQIMVALKPLVGTGLVGNRLFVFFATVSDAKPALIPLEIVGIFAVGLSWVSSRAFKRLEPKVENLLSLANAVKEGRTHPIRKDRPSNGVTKEFLMDIQLLKLFGLAEIMTTVKSQWRDRRENISLGLTRNVVSVLGTVQGVYTTDNLVGQVLRSFRDELAEASGRGGPGFEDTIERLRNEMLEVNDAARYYFELASETGLQNDFTKLMLQKSWS